MMAGIWEEDDMTAKLRKPLSVIAAVIMVLLLAVGTAVPALAAPTADMLVVDNADMLTAGEQLDIENMLLDINRQTGIEYVVYTMQSLNGQSIEDAAVNEFRALGLGDKTKNNGLLLAISLDDRKFRLEVGYGLEGIITDTLASNIINTMTDDFRQGDYASGIEKAIKRTAGVLNNSGEYGEITLNGEAADTVVQVRSFSEFDEETQKSIKTTIWVATGIFGGLFVLLYLFAGGSGGGSYSGGSSGSSFHYFGSSDSDSSSGGGWFGGGSSGGGGASGGW